MTDRLEEPRIHLRPREASALARDAAELAAENAALRERVKELERALGICRSFLMAGSGGLAHVRDFCGSGCGCVLATIRAALAAGSKEGA